MRRIRETCICFLVAVLFLCTVAPTAEALTQNDPAVSSGCHSIDAARPLENQTQVLETAKAAFVYERVSGTVIYAWNADSKVYPASMVKLMTALIALEEGDLADRVVVTQSALNQLTPGALTMHLVAGEELTLEQLLYGMMVASANDAAVVIAEHIAGSQAGFLARMNEKARELGCTGTSFSNTHGLHDEMTFTTARDVCRLVLAGLENEMFRTLFETTSYPLPATNKSEERKLNSTNYMMFDSSKAYYDQRVTGGRTGSTDAAGRCIAVTASDNGMELVCVIMGAQPTYSEDGSKVERFGSFEEMKDLLNYTYDGYTFHQLATQGQVLTQIPVENGANDVAINPEHSISAVLPVELNETALVWHYDFGALSAPVEAGQTLGSLQIWYGQICLGETALEAANSATVDTTLVMPFRPSEMDDRGSWITVVIIVGIAVFALAVTMIVRWTPRLIRKVQLRLRRKRRRIYRRRTR